jgi:hypothetical protein
LQEETNGVSNTHRFNEGVRSTVIANEVDTNEVENNALGEGDIRVDIKEVITFNNDGDLNELRQQQNGSSNIKEDTEQASLSFKPAVPSIEADENISVPTEKEQIKELHAVGSTTTTGSPQQFHNDDNNSNNNNIN